MRITFPQYTSYYTKTPSFKSNENEFYDSKGKVVNKTVTCFFRSDMDWETFAYKLANKYRNEDTVNIFDYAASDGSEAYTLTMSILTYTPQLSDKIFPIRGKDKFSDVVKEAQSGICNIYNSDLYAINYFTKNKFNYYFQATRATNPECPLAVKPKSPIKGKITFEKADILEDLDNLPDKNNVILCRNCWKYIDKDEYDTLAEKLYEKTQDNGLVVVGELEYGNGIVEILENHGFRETNLRNVFVPIKE